MSNILEGIRVVEAALYGYVPAAACVLADWGADVIKIEHPETGDPMRGLAAFGVKPGDGGVTMLWEVFNRGKRAVGIDIAHPDGREVLGTLVEGADVFLTNFLGPARRRLGIDADQIHARKPSIIYARGTGQGVNGPDADRGGFDGLSYWGRTGLATAAMPPDYDYPINLPGPAVGDIQAGLTLAGAITAALYHRERTGEGSVVDGSLLASGLWAMQPTIAGSYVTGREELPKTDRRRPNNPLANVYRTKDGRFISLGMLQADRYWAEFCRVAGRSEWIDDPRLASAEARYENVEHSVAMLDELFAQRSLAEWETILAKQDGQWSVVQTSRQAMQDPQALANGYVQMVKYDNGAELPMVPAPVQFNGRTPTLGPAPTLGEHTDDVLRECGLSDERILELKIDGVLT